jgi:putative transposase
MHDTLRELVRVAVGLHPELSTAVLDSQSVKTTEQGGVRGYDSGKQINRRKRHVLVDTMGLLLMVVVAAVNVQDQKGARLLLAILSTRFRRVRLLRADGSYAGLPLESWVRGLRKWCKVKLEMVRKPRGQQGFTVRPWRWIVERTFSWLGKQRRLKCDYERLPETTAALIHIAMIRLMVRRLAA